MIEWIECLPDESKAFLVLFGVVIYLFITRYIILIPSVNRFIDRFFIPVANKWEAMACSFLLSFCWVILSTGPDNFKIF